MRRAEHLPTDMPFSLSIQQTRDRRKIVFDPASSSVEEMYWPRQAGAFWPDSRLMSLILRIGSPGGTWKLYAGRKKPVILGTTFMYLYGVQNAISSKQVDAEGDVDIHEFSF